MSVNAGSRVGGAEGQFSRSEESHRWSYRDRWVLTKRHAEGVCGDLARCHVTVDGRKRWDVESAKGDGHSE